MNANIKMSMIGKATIPTNKPPAIAITTNVRIKQFVMATPARVLELSEEWAEGARYPDRPEIAPPPMSSKTLTNEVGRMGMKRTSHTPALIVHKLREDDGFYLKIMTSVLNYLKNITLKAHQTVWLNS